MRIKSNTILSFFAVALCAPLAIAQGTMSGQSQSQTQTPPAQQGQMQGQGPRRMGPGGGQMGPQNRMNGPLRPGMRGQMNGRGNWHHHHMHGRMGYRGGNNFRGGARPMWGGGGMGMRRGPMGGGGRPMGRAMLGGRGMMGGRGMGQGFAGGMGRGGAPLGRVLNNPDLQKQIGVTPEQVAKIKQQNLDFQKFSIENRATLQTRHLELNQLMSAATPNRAAIDTKLGEISAAQLAAEKERVHHQLDMKAALTADQQAKLKELMQSHQPGMGPGGRGGRGGPGMGRGGQPQPNKQPGSGDQPTTPDGSTSPDGKTI
jgi:Spy/CpxP family protein refolding chaperone